MDYNARYYSPSFGKFISADTIIPDPGNVLAWDRYAYAYNNPIRYNDPTGHWSCGDYYDADCIETEEEEMSYLEFVEFPRVMKKIYDPFYGVYGSLSSQEKKEKQEIFYLIERTYLENNINLETQVKNDKGDNILTIQMLIDSESLQEDPLAILPIMDDFEKRTTYAPYIRFLQALGKSTMGSKNAVNFMTNFDAYYLEALMMENPKILKEVQTEHINAMIEFVPNGAQMNMIDEVLEIQEWINMLWGLE